MIEVQAQDYRSCTGFLVADRQQNQHKKRLANNIRPSTSKPLILAKPGPSQARNHHSSSPHHPEKIPVKNQPQAV